MKTMEMRKAVTVIIFALHAKSHGINQVLRRDSATHFLNHSYQVNVTIQALNIFSNSFTVALPACYYARDCWRCDDARKRKSVYFPRHI